MDSDHPLRILFVEDVPADAELAQRALRTAGLAFTALRVETKDAFLAALAEFQPDLIISDYGLPDFDGLQALHLSLAHDAALPFIILTSRDEETAVACMKAGATDYVIKQRMTRLPFVVREALEQKRARLAAEEAERALCDQRELADTLREVAALLTGTLDLAAVLDQMLTHIGRVVPHTAANIMFIDAAAGVGRIAQSRGYDAIAPGLTEQVRQFRLPLSLANLRRMIETRQPIIIADTHTHPDWLVTPETAWARSYLGAPIGVRDQLVGFFNLDSDRPDFFTAEHAGRLMAFAAQAAAAIENARLFDAEHDARQLAEALRDTAAALSHSLNLDEVLNEVLNMVERVVPSDGANIMLVHGPLAHVARVGGRCSADSIGAEQHAIDATYNLRTMRDTGEPCILDYTRDNPRWRVLPGYEWIASYAGVPIRVHDELLGYLGLYSTQPGYFSARHTDRLKVFADQIALAVHNAQLHTSIQHHAEELEARVQQRTHELVAANEQLAAANVQLTELDRLKDQFISRISHELRTPLTNIKIYLELLDAGKPEKRATYMQVLAEQTDRLQALIEDLLEVSQLAAAKPAADLHPIDLNRIAVDLGTDRATQAQAQGLTLRTDLPPDLPPALGEASLVFQAATRVMANALAYTPRGGTITLSTARQPHAGQDWITLTVRDTGPGISAADLPHVFERFYRGAAASDYTVPGTGLGLAISQHILINLGGCITVESQPGTQPGAAFTLWLRPAP